MQGAFVGINDIDSRATLAAAQELAVAGYDVLPVTANAADASDVRRMIDTVLERTGHLDWLINNAAIYIKQTGPFWETSIADWNLVIEASLTSVFLCSKLAAPEMIEQGYGRIINIASQAAFGYVPWQGPHYHAAKAGVVHLTRTMAVDLAPHGVTVNSVAPTAVATHESQQRFSQDPGAKQRIEEHIPIGRFAQPEEVIAAISFLLSDGASYITGETLGVRGGLMGYGIRRDPIG